MEKKKKKRLFFQENAFENIVCKMVSILYYSQLFVVELSNQMNNVP